MSLFKPTNFSSPTKKPGSSSSLARPSDITRASAYGALESNSFSTISMLSSADAGEVVAALPFGGELAEEALHGALLGGIGGEGEGFAAGEFEELALAHGIGDVEAEVAGVAGG